MNQKKTYQCSICGKELMFKRDAFLHFPKKETVKSPGFCGISGGYTFCVQHANLFNTFLTWMGEWHKNGQKDDDPVYQKLNEVYQRS